MIIHRSKAKTVSKDSKELGINLSSVEAEGASFLVELLQPLFSLWLGLGSKQVGH